MKLAQCWPLKKPLSFLIIILMLTDLLASMRNDVCKDLRRQLEGVASGKVVVSLVAGFLLALVSATTARATSPAGAVRAADAFASDQTITVANVSTLTTGARANLHLTDLQSFEPSTTNTTSTTIFTTTTTTTTTTTSSSSSSFSPSKTYSIIANVAEELKRGPLFQVYEGYSSSKRKNQSSSHFQQSSLNHQSHLTSDAVDSSLSEQIVNRKNFNHQSPINSAPPNHQQQTSNSAEMVLQKPPMSDISNNSTAIINSTNNNSSYLFEANNNLSAESSLSQLNVNIALTTVYLAIFFIGVVGNVCNCLVIADSRNKYMKTATNYYLFSLSVSDLLLLIFGLPHDLVNLWRPSPYMFNQFVCISRGWISEASTNASVLVIVAFTVERYLAICHPLKAHTLSRLSRSVKIIILIWLVASSCALVVVMQYDVIMVSEKRGPIGPNGEQQEIANAQCTTTSRNESIFELSVLIFFIIPMTLITILYLNLGYHLRKKTAQLLKQQRAKKRRRLETRHSTKANGGGANFEIHNQSARQSQQQRSVSVSQCECSSSATNEQQASTTICDIKQQPKIQISSLNSRNNKRNKKQTNWPPNPIRHFSGRRNLDRQLHEELEKQARACGAISDEKEEEQECGIGVGGLNKLRLQSCCCNDISSLRGIGPAAHLTKVAADVERQKRNRSSQKEWEPSKLKTEPSASSSDDDDVRTSRAIMKSTTSSKDKQVRDKHTQASCDEMGERGVGSGGEEAGLRLQGKELTNLNEDQRRELCQSSAPLPSSWCIDSSTKQSRGGGAPVERFKKLGARNSISYESLPPVVVVANGAATGLTSEMKIKSENCLELNACKGEKKNNDYDIDDQAAAAAAAAATDVVVVVVVPNVTSTSDAAPDNENNHQIFKHTRALNKPPTEYGLKIMPPPSEGASNPLKPNETRNCSSGSGSLGKSSARNNNNKFANGSQESISWAPVNPAVAGTNQIQESSTIQESQQQCQHQESPAAKSRLYVNKLSQSVSAGPIVVAAQAQASSLTKTQKQANRKPIALNSTANAANLQSVIKMLVSVVVMFFICWAPFHAQRLMAVYVTEPTLEQEYIYNLLNHISGISYYISAIVNPILYSLFSVKFRQAFRDTFGSFTICSLPLSLKSNKR